MSDTVPRGSDDWRRVVEIVSEITESRGLGPKEWDDAGLPAQSISISYGAATLPAGDRADFERRLAPFDGLEQPTTTTSH